MFRSISDLCILRRFVKVRPVSATMANVAQLVELQIVVLAVAGSSPVIRPILRHPLTALTRESLRVTVRLNTGAPGWEERVSAQK
jgi:hypothetical protein